MTPEQVAEAFAIGKRVANGYLQRTPQMRHYRDDITSDSLLGASKGIRDHQPLLGPWDGYVAFRAQHEILDGLRARGPVSRLEWQRGVRPDDLPEQLRTAVSLETLHGLGRNDEVIVISVHDPHSEDGYRQVEARLTVARLLPLLSVKARDIITSHDLNGETLSQIGLRYGVSESHICRLRKLALRELRDAA